MSKGPRNDLMDRMVCLGLRFTSMVFDWFPVNLNLKTAAVIGTFWYWFDKRHRARALANLQNCFPDYPPARRERIARASVQHMFMLGVEVLHTTRLVRIDTWRNYVDLHDFQGTLRLLMERHRGIIMLTGHYGNWEILGYVLATLGFPSTSVARPLDNPYINNWLFGVREKRGQKLLLKKGATPEISTLLEEGEAVGFVADQNAGSKGVFVDFFGRKASTYKSIALLAMEHRVPVVIGYSRRLSGKFHFRIATQDIIYPEDWEKEADPLIYVTQRYTKAIEDFVRTDPSQYLWMHRRWKTRPKGETPMRYD